MSPLSMSAFGRFFLRTRFVLVGVSGEGVISSPQSDALADVFRRRHGNVELASCGEMLSAHTMDGTRRWDMVWEGGPAGDILPE